MLLLALPWLPLVSRQSPHLIHRQNRCRHAYHHLTLQSRHWMFSFLKAKPSSSAVAPWAGCRPCASFAFPFSVAGKKIQSLEWVTVRHCVRTSSWPCSVSLITSSPSLPYISSGASLSSASLHLGGRYGLSFLLSPSSLGLLAKLEGGASSEGELTK